MRRIIGIGIIVFFVLSGWLSAGYIWPSLQQELDRLGPNETIRVHIYLLAQPDRLRVEIMDSRQAVREYLKNFARNSQTDILSYLTAQEDVFDIRCWWTSNVISLTTTRDEIKKLAIRQDVNYLVDDFIIKLDSGMQSADIEAINFSPELQWNIELIRADHVWQNNITGKGVVIGFVDSGIDVAHRALRDNIRPFDFWFDGVFGQEEPYDDIGHGTHCAGIAAGQDGIGVAPEAQIVMARAFWGGVGQIEWVRSCFEWYAEMDSPPDILSNSWAITDEYNLDLWDDILTLEALGIKVVFAAGNTGSVICCTPGNYPTVMAVGATDEDDNIAGFSARGPAPDILPWIDTNYWLRSDWNLIVPTISAPGVQILSSIPGGRYQKKSGTSMACPHIAGVIALMLQKEPDLNFKQIYWQLTKTAVRVNPELSWPNNDYGWGRVDALAAVDIYIPKPKQNELSQIFPNPFSQIVTIRYGLSVRSTVIIKIYDKSGRLVRTLLPEEEKAARYWQIKWNGRDNSGKLLSNGIYFCYFETYAGKNSIRNVKKIILLR